MNSILGDNYIFGALLVDDAYITKETKSCEHGGCFEWRYKFCPYCGERISCFETIEYKQGFSEIDGKVFYRERWVVNCFQDKHYIDLPMDTTDVESISKAAIELKEIKSLLEMDGHNAEYGFLWVSSVF